MEEIFIHKKLCENIINVKGKENFNIKKEQDLIKFLRLIIEYLKEKLNQKDNKLNFNFNNKKKLSKLSEKPEYLNDLDKIINERNSKIGKLFSGLIPKIYI